jgi:hypothetical protein
MIGGVHVKGAKFVVTQTDLKEISLVPRPWEQVRFNS